MSVNLGRVKFKNPLIAASGTFGCGREFSRLEKIEDWGGIVVKTLTLRPKTGNPSPRIYETDCGVINSIGLENSGLADFLENKAEFVNNAGTNVFVSIYGRNIKEWLALVEKIDYACAENIAGFELNLSCPNLNGRIVSYSAGQSAKIIKSLRLRTRRLLVSKLSFSGRIIDVAKACMDAGADAITLINTLPAMAVDVYSCRPVLGAKTGGLSGPAIKPVAVNAVYQVYKALNAPLIASGGAFVWQDVLEFILAGAKLVQLGTVNFTNSAVVNECLDGLAGYCRKKRITKIRNLTAKANEKV